MEGRLLIIKTVIFYSIIGIPYQSKDQRYKLTFINDSTFNYRFRFGYKLQIADGKWKKVDDLIILNSYLDDLLTIPLKVDETFDKENQDSLIFIINSSVIKDSTCNYYIIADNNEFKSAQNTIKVKKISDINSFKVCYSCSSYNGIPFLLTDTLSSVTYSVRSRKSNVYEIKWNINDESFNYLPIKNDSLYVRSHNIYWPNNDIMLKRDKGRAKSAAKSK
jgi:hypothetical protein